MLCANPPQFSDSSPDPSCSHSCYAKDSEFHSAPARRTQARPVRPLKPGSAGTDEIGYPFKPELTQQTKEPLDRPFVRYPAGSSFLAIKLFHERAILNRFRIENQGKLQ